jgi:hypothetical protein
MPGYILHKDAFVTCAHGAEAKPSATNARVRVSGHDTISWIPPYGITNCPQNSPCASATWTTAATRVTSVGQPLVLMDSESTSVPNSLPLKLVQSQKRVQAT